MLFFIVLCRIYIFVLRSSSHMPGILVRTTDECLFNRALIKVPTYTLYLMPHIVTSTFSLNLHSLCDLLIWCAPTGKGLVSDTVFRKILPKQLRTLTNRFKAQCCCSECLPMSHMQQSLSQLRRSRLGELKGELNSLQADPLAPAAADVALAGGKPKGHEPQALPGAT